MNIKDVKVSQDGEQTCEWKLWKHNNNICFDEMKGAIARAESPYWLIDDHIEWKQIYRVIYQEDWMLPLMHWMLHFIW